MSKKISQLTDGNPAQTGDLLAIDRGGANFSVTADSVAALGGGGGGVQMVSTEGSIIQKIAVGTDVLSSGSKAITIPPSIYDAGYQWAAVATSFTSNPVSAGVAVGNQITFHGTGTDAFSFIIFPIFQFS